MQYNSKIIDILIVLLFTAANDPVLSQRQHVRQN